MESDQRIQLTVIWSKCEPRGHPAYQVAGELETQGEKKKKRNTGWSPQTTGQISLIQTRGRVAYGSTPGCSASQ